MKKITQKDVDKAWKKAWDTRDEALEVWKAWEETLEAWEKDWEKALDEAWELQRKFKEQEDLK